MADMADPIAASDAHRHFSHLPHLSIVEWPECLPPGFRYSVPFSDPTTWFLRVPIDSISTSTAAPGESQAGSGWPNATPDGVPVEIRSPGNRVVPVETKLMISATEYSICAVALDWQVSPSTRHMIDSRCGSGISSVVVRDGPTGENVSKDFPLVH